MWYSLRLALADAEFRENTPSSIKRAVSLAPSNASYHELLAEHLEAAGQNPDSELDIATELSPRESRYWIRRAFRAELERKYQESEHYLLQAGAVDRGFDPRWALMNFYFRRGDLPQFWKYAREAMERSYGDRDAIFRLCLAANDDPAATREILPARRDILFSFFTYLMKQGRLDDAAKVADEFSSKPQPEEGPALLDYCSRRMSRDPASVLRVWNGLCAAHLVPFPALLPDKGLVVTNGDFEVQRSVGGFDWKYSPDPSISISPSDTNQGLSIQLNASQPDRIALLEQEIPLTPGKQYSIEYSYRLSEPSDDSGLHWAIFPVDTASATELALSPTFAGEDWQNATMTFRADHEAARLVLIYRRALGTVRWKGAVQIRSVKSELAEAGHGK